MLFVEKSFGLVSETGGFLVNPGPEPSEPAVVEASDDFDNETKGLVNETERVLVNPGPEPSEAAVVEASDDFNKEKRWLGQRKKKLSAKSASGGFRTGRATRCPFCR